MMVCLMMGSLTYTMASTTVALSGGVDCEKFANEVEGEAGDAGDYDTWFQAFEFCSNEQGMGTATPR